jgi:class 3 adenylate cyclase
MALADELSSEVARIFREQWQRRDGQVVPEPDDLKLTANDAVHLKRATILYADLSDSTDLVDSKEWNFSAEIYQTFLYCAGRIVRNEGGKIVAYDGDRIMAVFFGDTQSTNAARCALKINFAVKNIVNPALRKQYPNSAYVVHHVVGIDTSMLHAARIGVRGGNDIVWVGRAANYAAKLTSLDHKYPTWITKAVFDVLQDKSKYGGSENKLMWKEWKWNQKGGIPIYSSTWWWSV